eukprot:TRINITY_DN19388_c0_g1_i1.p1 TRINITY_DN19388_c0_g1~~TRINITY_DN19388_c0_g1_i1.p1  ORF type:complete len:115 (+),score=19.56 TRINITY_DN19388_c0_g1_i1:47-346(+)
MCIRDRSTWARRGENDDKMIPIPQQEPQVNFFQGKRKPDQVLMPIRQQEQTKVMKPNVAEAEPSPFLLTPFFGNLLLVNSKLDNPEDCLLYTSPSPRDS